MSMHIERCQLMDFGTYCLQRRDQCAMQPASRLRLLDISLRFEEMSLTALQQAYRLRSAAILYAPTTKFELICEMY